VGARAAALERHVRGTPREDDAGLAEVTQHCFGRLLGTVKDCFRPKADDGDEDRFKSFYRPRQNFCLLDAVQRFALRRQA